MLSVLMPYVAAAAASGRLMCQLVEGQVSSIRITYEGDNYLRFTGLPIRDTGAPVTEYQKLYARSETEFFPKGRPGVFTFGGDAGKPAETFSFRFQGEDIVATRID